jgi:hypothetical protein
MSNYTKTTNFASKDALSSGDPAKKIKGTEFNVEFDAIATAVATKADLASPAFTGNPTAPTQTAADSSTKLATTAFVQTELTSYAPKASPTFTGTVTIPTATVGDNTTKAASTAFVKTAIDNATSTGLPTTGGTMTGPLNLESYTLKRIAMSSTSVDLAEGNYFSYTVSGTTTFTFDNVPSGTVSSGFVLELTNGGVASVTYPASVKWAGGTAPTLTASGVDVLVFITDDNGTTWRGAAAMIDSK